MSRSQGLRTKVDRCTDVHPVLTETAFLLVVQDERCWRRLSLSWRGSCLWRSVFGRRSPSGSVGWCGRQRLSSQRGRWRRLVLLGGSRAFHAPLCLILSILLSWSWTACSIPIRHLTPSRDLGTFIPRLDGHGRCWALLMVRVVRVQTGTADDGGLLSVMMI